MEQFLGGNGKVNANAKEFWPKSQSNITLLQVVSSATYFNVIFLL